MKEYGILLLLAVGALFLLLFPATLLECDAVIYACAGLAGDMVQNTDAGHLAWGFFELGAARMGAGHPIGILRWLSLLSALATVFLFYRTLMVLGSDWRISLGFAGLLLFSYSFWHFSLQAEPHLPSTAFLAGFLLMVVMYDRAPGTGRAALAALCLGLATLLHQTSILMTPAFLVFLLFRESTKDTWRRHVPAFLTTYFLAAIVPYLLVGYFVRDLRTIPEFKGWIMGLSTWGGWGYWTMTTPLKSIIGLLRSLVGSHFMLGLEPVMDFAARLFPGASWDDELLLAGKVPTWVTLPLVVVEVAVLAGLGALLVRLVRRRRHLWQRRRGIMAFLLTWLLAYGGFIMWWAPERAEFWIGVILPLLVLAASSYGTEDRIGARAVSGLTLLLAGLLVVNFLGSIWPQAAADIEPETRLLLEIDAVTRPGDYILSSSSFRGRASRYVYSLNKLNLRQPRLFLASIESPGAESGHGPMQSGPNLVEGMSAQEAVAHVMGMAAASGHRVFLIPDPLWLEAEQAEEFNLLVRDILERWENRPRHLHFGGCGMVELLTGKSS